MLITASRDADLRMWRRLTLARTLTLTLTLALALTVVLALTLALALPLTLTLTSYADPRPSTELAGFAHVGRFGRDSWSLDAPRSQSKPPRVTAQEPTYIPRIISSHLPYLSPIPPRNLPPISRAGAARVVGRRAPRGAAPLAPLEQGAG